MNNVITLSQAVSMTSLFRTEKNRILNPDLSGQNILPNCETYDREAIDKILSQTGCVQLRIYYGLNPELQLRAIIVGVNSKGEDILPSEKAIEDDNVIVEDGFTCPPICATSSPLNP